MFQFHCCVHVCVSVFVSPPAISNAYSVLSDADKRQQYDTYGEEGLRPSTGGHAHYYSDFDQFDLFRQMFTDEFFGDCKHHQPIIMWDFFIHL